MKVYYNGEAWNATTEGEEMSLSILKNAARKMTWQWTDEGNQVKLLIRA